MCHFPVTSSGLVVLWKRLEQLLKLTSRSVTSMLNHCDKLCHSWTAIANDDDVYSDRLCHWLLSKRDKSELQCVKFATADLGGWEGVGVVYDRDLCGFPKTLKGFFTIVRLLSAVWLSWSDLVYYLLKDTACTCSALDNGSWASLSDVWREEMIKSREKKQPQHKIVWRGDTIYG